jgi:hypothetical protein
MGGTIGLFTETSAQKQAQKEQDLLQAQLDEEKRLEEERLREEQQRMLSASGRVAGGGTSRMLDDTLG